MRKKVLAILSGMAVSFIVISLMELLATFVYPIPQSLNFSNPEEVKLFMQQLPVTAILFVLMAYATGSFLGGLIASLVSGRQAPQASLSIGALLTCGGISNIITLPGQPLWMIIASFLIYIPFAYLGYWVVKKDKVVSAI